MTKPGEPIGAPRRANPSGEARTPETGDEVGEPAGSKTQHLERLGRRLANREVEDKALKAGADDDVIQVRKYRPLGEDLLRC